MGAILAIHGRGSEIWVGGEFGLEQFDQGRFRNIAAVDDEWLRGISGNRWKQRTKIRWLT